MDEEESFIVIYIWPPESPLLGRGKGEVSLYLPNISRMPSISNDRVKRKVWSNGLLCAVDIR